MSKALSPNASPSMGLFGFFTNRRINTKIMIGFAIVLALLAVLSVLSYRGFIKVSDGFGAFNQRVKVVSIVRDVDRGFVAFRRFVREFALSGDETDRQSPQAAGSSRKERQAGVRRDQEPRASRQDDRDQ